MVRRPLLALACLSALAGCASGLQTGGGAVPSGAEGGFPTPGGGSGAATVAPEMVSGELPAPKGGPLAENQQYRIGPLDTLEIQVFQVPEVSRSAQVASNGEISLPLIGSINVVGKTVGEVEAIIAAKLRKFLQSPQVTVEVSGYNSQRVTVDGAVGRPGIFSVTPDMTLLQVVAQSGGLKRSASSGDVLIFRTIDNQRMVARFDVDQMRNGTLTDPPIYGGDVIVVPESAIRSAYSDLMSVMPMARFVSGTF